MDQFLNLFFDEATERSSREIFTRAIGTAQASGQDARGAVLRGLQAVTGDANLLARGRQIAARIPGFSFTPQVLATALASWMRTSKLADNILPRDTSGFAMGVRAIVRLLPAGIIGLGDAGGDLLERWVNNVSDDPTRAQADRNGALDRVFRTRLIPGRVFIAAVNSAGEIQYRDDGSPFVNDQEWTGAYDMWRDVNTERRETRGGGRNAQPDIIPARPFPFERVPMDQAVQALGALRATGTDLDQIRDLFRKSDFGRDISDDTVLVLAALSRASLQFRGIVQRLSEDLFKDLPGKVNINLLNRLLGARFAPLVLNPTTRPTLEREDYLAAMALIDQWLGGELQVGNRIFRGISEAYDNLVTRGWNPLVAGLWALVISSPIWGASVLMVATFLMGVVYFVEGFFTQSTGTSTLVGYVVPGAAAASYKMAAGYMLVFAVTWFMPLWQKIVDLIPFLRGEQKDWLASVGRKIASTALMFGGMCAFAGWMGIPVLYRILLPIGGFMTVGTALALVEAGRKEMAKAKLAMSVRYIEWFFGVGPIVLCFVCGMIASHTGTFVTGITLIGFVLGFIAKLVAASKWLSVAAIMVLGLVAAVLVHMKSTRLVEQGGRVYRLRTKIPFAIPAILGLVASLIAFVFLADPSEKMKLSDIFDPTVTVEDITTVDASNGSWMREKVVISKSGDVFEKTTGKVVKNAGVKTTKTTPPRDLCASNPPPDVARDLGCPTKH